MPDNSQNPKISFVVTSRNDDHGGEMLKRMRIFLRGLDYQCGKFKVEAELIIVEWNPPSHKPPIGEMLSGILKSGFLQVRCIVVPAGIHNNFRFSDAIPLYQMIAKNTGIRRAKAEWICCTNVDLLFSNELFRFLASEKFRTNAFYRANRVDYPAGIDEKMPVESQLKFAWKNQVDRFGKNRRFPNIESTRFLRLFPFPGPGLIVAAFSQIKKLFSKAVLNTFRELDTDACGDFTLMHKEAWIAIRGYAEIDLYSIHIDSLAILSAAAAGYRQVILHPRAVTFHMEHTTGWATPDPMDKFKLNIQRPGLDWNTVRDLGLYLLKTKKPLEWNNPNWGFNDQKFTEYRIPIEND